MKSLKTYRKICIGAAEQAHTLRKRKVRRYWNALGLKM